MTASKFVIEYKKLAPTYEELKNIKVSEVFIAEEVNRYDISRNETSGFSDDLWDLVNSYDVEKANISDLRLGLGIEETNNYYYVGLFEENDRIVVDKASGLVKIVNKDSNQELFLCAINSSRFLEVLLVLAKYFINCMVNVNLYDDFAYRKNEFSKCVDIAGGEKYSDFYEYIFVL